jgi:hypothetical protein
MSQRALIELLRGKGAHADPVACVEDISAELAEHRVEGFPHSIAALVFHMNYWMDYELRRIRGDRPAYPVHNSESFPTESSSANSQDWEQLRKQFASLLADFAGWRILLRTKCKGKSHPRMKEIPSLQEHLRLYCGRWSRTTVTISAKLR